MRQAIHLLVVDCNRAAALAAVYGAKWSLPILTCDQRVRAAPRVLHWAAEHGIVSDVAGQWLGRVAPDRTDWLMAIRVAQPSPALPSPLDWTPLPTLSSAMPVLDYQGWALTSSLEGRSLPSVPGPFGNLLWLDEVKAWISGAAGAMPSAFIPYRVTAHEVVLGADILCARVYFKGLTDERAAEARLTETLAAVAPSSFARTLAVEARPDGSVWWLTAECPGRTADTAAVVARELARLQRRVMASGPVLRELRRMNVDAAVQWAYDFVRNERSVEDIRRHTRRVAAADVPESWTPMDLDPTNVLVDDAGTVRFIDLDDSYVGPAPLAMATFAKRCRDTSLYRVYEQSWSPPLADVEWRSFEVVAAVFEAWLGWQRVERNTRRGEVHGALGPAAIRLRERLAKVVHRG